MESMPPDDAAVSRTGRDALAAELARQILQVRAERVDLHAGLRLARAGAVFVRSREMAGAQTGLGGGRKVARMGGHHHAFAGRQIERLAGGEIDVRLGLEVAGDLGAEDRVPWKVVAARE